MRREQRIAEELVGKLRLRNRFLTISEQVTISRTLAKILDVYLPEDEEVPD